MVILLTWQWHQGLHHPAPWVGPGLQHHAARVWPEEEQCGSYQVEQVKMINDHHTLIESQNNQ